MIFSWFNTRAVDVFVETEVADLVRRVPVEKLTSGGRRVEDQLAKSHDLLLRRTSEFARREKPNFFQKARLANRLKWALTEARYPKAFVDELAYAVAAVSAAANSQREL